VNIVHSKRAATGGHGREELAELARKVCGLASVHFDHLPEKVIGQKTDAVREEAEKQTHEEVRGALRFNPSAL
jgi:hypothetical protein